MSRCAGLDSEVRLDGWMNGRMVSRENAGPIACCALRHASSRVLSVVSSLLARLVWRQGIYGFPRLPLACSSTLCLRCDCVGVVGADAAEILCIDVCVCMQFMVFGALASDGGGVLGWPPSLGASSTLMLLRGRNAKEAVNAWCGC